MIYDHSMILAQALRISEFDHGFCCSRGFSQRPVLSSTQQLLGTFIDAMWGCQATCQRAKSWEFAESQSHPISTEPRFSLERPFSFDDIHPQLDQKIAMSGKRREPIDHPIACGLRNMNPQLGRIFRQKFPPRQALFSCTNMVCLGTCSES